jgi:hypothetical protein
MFENENENICRECLSQVQSQQSWEAVVLVNHHYQTPLLGDWREESSQEIQIF